MASRLTFLEGDDRQHVVDLPWLARWSRAPTERALLRKLMTTPWARHRWHVVAQDSDEGVLAFVFVYELAYRLDFRRLRLAGLGEVRVRPDLAKHGYDRFFLKGVHDRLKSEGYDGSVRFVPASAARQEADEGYELLSTPSLLADLRDFRDAAPVGPSASTVRCFEPRDFDAVRNLYNTSTSLQRLAVLRDDESWEHQLMRARLVRWRSPHDLPEDFVVGERDGRVVSYLRASRRREGGALRILECAFEPGATADVAALLQDVLGAIGPRAPKVLRCAVPSRLANLVPARRRAWHHGGQRHVVMRSFGSFEVPKDMHPDDRFIWQSDWLSPAVPAAFEVA